MGSLRQLSGLAGCRRPGLAGKGPRKGIRAARTGVVLAAIACLCVPIVDATPLLADAATEVREWNFRVLLDDSEIGYHRFRLTDTGDERQLSSEASFDVRFLFVTAYRYRHMNRETWSGRCLERIETDTDANGRELQITGERESGRFIVEAGDSVRQLPECVMSFAYWDPRFLGEQRLLNPQTGEYVDVEIQKIDEGELTVRGRQVAATQYRIVAKGVNVDVWYSDEREWVALESEAKGGRKIRYELI